MEAETGPSLASKPKTALTAQVLWCITVISMGAIFWGYDIGVISTILVAPGFKAALSNPSSSETGTITAIFYLGQFVGYGFLAGPVNNRLGRRWAGAVGVVILCVGAALQAGAVHLSTMIIGRIIAGLGTGIVSCSVPLYLSEISPAHVRGAFVATNQLGIVFGISMAFWVGYGFSFWNTGSGVDLQWRLSIIMQFIPAIIFLVGVPTIPESPRWLVSQDRIEDAVKALTKLRGTEHPDAIQDELDEIHANIMWHKQYSVTSFKVFFTDNALWARLWRAWAISFLQQMSGAGGIRYYLPTNFRAAGTSETLSLLASGLDGTVQVGCTAVGIFLIDRIGRRHALGGGAIIMAWCLLINGALQLAYPNQSNASANYCNIFFIFFFTVGYSIGFGPCAWIYSSEIFPAHVRSKGLGISVTGQSIGSIIVGQVWPVAVDQIGPKTYFIFMAFNIFAAVLVYATFPETKKKTLEELDSQFGSCSLQFPEADGTKEVEDGEREHVEVVCEDKRS
ncbi:general substrate transporter [Aspergillus granulosus]|uniref:General substrate transporter n=1 Tax=Aspergillus granulosus TaxID=176169 RepID=A0ABR4GWZ5_9EURO